MIRYKCEKNYNVPYGFVRQPVCHALEDALERYLLKPRHCSTPHNRHNCKRSLELLGEDVRSE
jgi:hypothetical protein